MNESIKEEQEQKPEISKSDTDGSDLVGRTYEGQAEMESGWSHDTRQIVLPSHILEF
jgi:hypothetical protein